ncbi:uncharacterized protein CTHT_0024420 [Thermochaetoides thermophila DSM 1495]|uniref:Uncharacterized protein n=1 Tax=Chaetomium thermophilum (strain DSM 1495 / CBS 144.50 / IMI 039719) TaxID=759272 RepID=G0S5D5_CHATD|nr:hypothetical protein CTHT_0024420 [Thermochaetoides thermophila DSM 1495]EGS20608.1 hypothetical protein CTHT_0024420 [Thermochaetoides thermophila DSM 1495]
MAERKKIVHALDTPYSAVEWPHINQEDQDAILELLCHLLAPLGNYRRTFITPSKGKRKRSAHKKDAPAAPVPPAPELASYVDVGLSQISRNLQAMASSKSQPKPSSEVREEDKDNAMSIDAPAHAVDNSNDGIKPYTIVFVPRGGQSPAFNSHFPQMVALAARSQPAETAVRLVGFSKACEDRLSAVLGIPRVSSIAICEGAPQAKGLVDYVREKVPPVDVAWLKEARRGEFLETKIDAIVTKIGTKKQRTS